jgi:riboflavin kinase/FMN adenylyltransferase
MIVLYGIDSVPPRQGRRAGDGNFDACIAATGAAACRQEKPTRSACRQARSVRAAPARVLSARQAPLPPDAARAQAADRAFGLGLAVVLTFDAQLAGLPAQEFIERVVARALTARHVVIGYDFRFGRGRSGDPETMRRAGGALGFGVTVVAQVGEAGEVFSSNAIRAELAQGDVAGAAQMLGHWWRVKGRVIGGFKRGTDLGFPTANIALPPGTALSHGIYAVRVHVEKKVYSGAAYLGTRPTFDNGAPMLEVFLFDFEGDLYGKEIAVEFIDHVRADAKFGSVDALKEQIAKDCARAQAILETATPEPLYGG